MELKNQHFFIKVNNSKQITTTKKQFTFTSSIGIKKLEKLTGPECRKKNTTQLVQKLRKDI